MKKGLIILGVLVAVVVGVVAWATGYYNKFVTYNEVIAGNWAQVENVLQRRNDLVPNLVNTVKGIAKQEKEVFQGIADARARIGSAQTPTDKMSAHNGLGSALGRLLLIVERYPELKSSENFIRLQDELAGTENRIAVERKRYNDSIRDYNIMVKRFPGKVLAGLFGYSQRDDYFNVPEEAKAVPQVQF